ncbi:LOW QUALITY PROTEIN: conserved hypothetical protein, partial [Brucella abortus bv. 2 str. 86/8/59]
DRAADNGRNGKAFCGICGPGLSDPRRGGGWPGSGLCLCELFPRQASLSLACRGFDLIAPDAKGQGIGKLLLRELIARISALGFRQLLAVIGDGEHNIGSVKLHESLGFTHCGRIEGSGFKHGRWLDTVLMQLPLNGGRSTEPGPSPLS